MAGGGLETISHGREAGAPPRSAHGLGWASCASCALARGACGAQGRRGRRGRRAARKAGDAREAQGEVFLPLPEEPGSPALPGSIAVVELEGKGCGVVATAPISRGETILRESPLLYPPFGIIFFLFVYI